MVRGHRLLFSSVREAANGDVRYGTLFLGSLSVEAGQLLGGREALHDLGLDCLLDSDGDGVGVGDDVTGGGGLSPSVAALSRASFARAGRGRASLPSACGSRGRGGRGRLRGGRARRGATGALASARCSPCSFTRLGSATRAAARTTRPRF
jgi:hypothetical protein